MNNLTRKMPLFGMIISILLIASITSCIYANEEQEIIVLKKAENKYLVYFKDLCSSAFQFAISDESTTLEADLNFVASAKDSTEEGALNVAFIDDTNHPQADKDVYIWIKDSTDTIVVSAQKIDIKENILDDNIINFINTTTIANKDTDRIKVDTTQTQTTNSVVDGVDTTVKTGKIVIDKKEGATYYYVLVNANDATSKAGELYGLADKINNYSGNSYGKLKLAKDFYNLYLELMPKDSEWIKVSDKEILQPEDTKAGDKFIVYIREYGKDKKEITDVKLLECIREEAQGKNQKEEVVKEEVKQTVKLPVTYDNPTLIIVFAILIAAIILVVILKKNQVNNHEKHSK